MKKISIVLLTCLLTISLSVNAKGKVHNIKIYGAKAAAWKKLRVVNSTLPSEYAAINTKAIQAAIDAAAGKGDTVLIPKGIFETGTLFLKSNVTIKMDPLAWIYGSPNLDDYADVGLSTEEPHFSRTLFFAEGLENITIIGDQRSEINGRGYFFKHAPQRPKLFRIEKCKNVNFDGFRIQNSGSWCTVFTECDSVRVHNITVMNEENRNNDGIDLDGCSNVWITDCNLQVADDAICLKASTKKACENIHVEDCTIRSFTAAVKFGTASMSAFRNVTIKNCQFFNCVHGGIKLLAVDGCELEDIEISDIKMYNCGGPIFLRLGNRGRDYTKSIRQVYKKDAKPEGRPVGKLRNIVMRNIEGRLVARHDSTECIMFTGIPGHYIENITMENIHYSYSGHGNVGTKNRIVPEDEARYPEQAFFGVLPAYGMYLRHIKGLKLKNVTMTLRNAESRPFIVMDDVIESQFEDITFDICKEAKDGIVIKNCKDMEFNKIQPIGKVKHLLKVEGDKSTNIRVRNSKLHATGIKQIARFKNGASKKAVNL